MGPGRALSPPTWHKHLRRVRAPAAWALQGSGPAGPPKVLTGPAKVPPRSPQVPPRSPQVPPRPRGTQCKAGSPSSDTLRREKGTKGWGLLLLSHPTSLLDTALAPSRTSTWNLFPISTPMLRFLPSLLKASRGCVRTGGSEELDAVWVGTENQTKPPSEGWLGIPWNPSQASLIPTGKVSLHSQGVIPPCSARIRSSLFPPRSHPASCPGETGWILF